MSTEKSQQLQRVLEGKLQNQILKSEVNLGDLVVSIEKSSLLDFCRVLKMDTELNFNLLVDITAIDWLDSKSNRFEMVYHFLSFTNHHRLRLKASLEEADPSIDSLVSLWAGANFLEREVWDMYGIKFIGHPDLRRILMYDEFEGHPLRKDYPVQGKQPRVKMRSAEVENTARQMRRAPLVQINKKVDPEHPAEIAKTIDGGHP